jgi:hypothetical protein
MPYRHIRRHLGHDTVNLIAMQQCADILAVKEHRTIPVIYNGGAGNTHNGLAVQRVDAAP